MNDRRGVAAAAAASLGIRALYTIALTCPVTPGPRRRAAGH